MFVVGLFNSRQKFLFLPFSESDFIFSIIGEEFGFIGCIAICLVYLIIIIEGIKIAYNAIDRLGAYLAYGITSVVAIQMLINVAVVTGSIPPTGIPLPFISAGGSSLIVFLASIGILVNISMQSNYKKTLQNSLAFNFKVFTKKLKNKS
jgi:cell division protein FtsW